MIDPNTAMEEQEKNGLNIVRVRVVPGLRLMSEKPITSPEEAVDFLTCQFKDLDREMFMILNLTTDMKVINLDICSVGTLNYACVHPREVFKCSLLSNSSSCLLIHNHPSGSLVPSQPDIDVSNRLASAGRLLGIEVMDSLIIGPKEHTWCSLRRQEYMELDGMDWQDLEKAAEKVPEQTL